MSALFEWRVRDGLWRCADRTAVRVGVRSGVRTAVCARRGAGDCSACEMRVRVGATWLHDHMHDFFYGSPAQISSVKPLAQTTRGRRHLFLPTQSTSVASRAPRWPRSNPTVSQAQTGLYRAAPLPSKPR